MREKNIHLQQKTYIDHRHFSTKMVNFVNFRYKFLQHLLTSTIYYKDISSICIPEIKSHESQWCKAAYYLDSYFTCPRFLSLCSCSCKGLSRTKSSLFHQHLCLGISFALYLQCLEHIGSTFVQTEPNIAWTHSLL